MQTNDTGLQFNEEPEPHGIILSLLQWSSVKWGLCVPATCSRQDLRGAIQAYMDEETSHGGEVRVEIHPQACTTRDSASRSVTLIDIIYW